MQNIKNGDITMLLMNERISLRIHDKILRNAKKRTQQILKQRKAEGKNYSISQYLRELLENDFTKREL